MDYSTFSNAATPILILIVIGLLAAIYHIMKSKKCEICQNPIVHVPQQPQPQMQTNTDF